MKKQGTVVRWDSAKGFGFIRSGQTTADVFFHIRDYRGSEAPVVGQSVGFEEIVIGGKGPRAMDVHPAGMPASGMPRPAARRPSTTSRPPPAPRPTAPRRPPPPASPRTDTTGVALGLMLLWIALLGLGVWRGQLGWVLLPALLGLNLMTFFLYWQDKHAAQHGQWRTKENHLHLLALLGGWPGAWLAQRVLRHKTVKAPFVLGYWATVGLHLVLLALWVFAPEVGPLLGPLAGR